MALNKMVEQPGKKRLLLMVDWFDPAFKAGGPIRSCVNFVKEMQSDFDLWVLTSDRDIGDTKSLDGIETDIWVDYIEGVKVFYASPYSLSFSRLLSLIRDIHPHTIYLNSMFSRYFAIYPLLMRRMGLISDKIVLAPRGMLKNSALKYKSTKKGLYLKTFRLLRFPGFIHFHATDPEECDDIKTRLGAGSISIAANFSEGPSNEPEKIIKEPGKIALIFIGRIHPIKNLHYLLSILKKVEGVIKLTIVGVLEDQEYWNICKSMITTLPENVQVEFLGELPHQNLAGLISKNHLLVLPTLGENFGHAIAESLRQGRPVLISDQTPWRNLQLAGAGWDISLERPDEFISALQSATNWNCSDYSLTVGNTLRWFKENSKTEKLKHTYLNIF